MRSAICLLVLAPVLYGADSDFNGRWDLRVDHAPSGRAWWLEVTGAGTSALRGRFVGFPGGDTDDIPSIRIEGGALRFSSAASPNPQECEARYDAGKLQGFCRRSRQEWAWTGERAPEIPDRDDGSWKPRKPIALFNGRDLAGWEPATGWSVEKGILKTNGGGGNLLGHQTFWNFQLHVEFRMARDSNSGIGLRNRYEVQILDDYGKPGDLHSTGSLYSRIPAPVNAGKPPGQWQAFDIRLVGRHVNVVLNGKKVVSGVIEGLTAMAQDPDEGRPGPIALQGDHGPVAYRSVRVRRLP